jgi:GAF domain-containing protein
MRRYVHRIARALGSALESQDAPQLLADILVEVMRADRCAIYRVAQDGLRLHTVSRFPAGSPPEAHVPSGQGLAGAVSKSGRPVVVADIGSDPRSSAHPWLLRESLTSFLGVPLKVGRRTVGVVEIFTTEPREFSGDDVKLLNEFARRARAAQHLLVEGP